MASIDLIREQLRGLEQCPDNALPEYFNRNLNSIFTCNKFDIIAAINTKDITRLKEIRHYLLEGVGILFDKYSNRKAITRTKANTICDDIFYLGHSLVHKSQCKQLEKIYNSTIAETTVVNQPMPEDAANINSSQENSAML